MKYAESLQSLEFKAVRKIQVKKHETCISNTGSNLRGDVRLLKGEIPVLKKLAYTPQTCEVSVLKPARP